MSYPVLMVPAGDVVPVFFDTYAGATGASITMSGLAVTDIEIYKDGSITQRASDNGYTLLDTDGIDFDGLTGIHGFSIDTGDNSDASFYTVGAWFTVIVSAITVDSQTVSFIACQFRLMAAEAIAGKPKADVDAWLGTAAATPTVAGVPEVDVTHWIGTAAATPTVAGVPEVDITHIAGAVVATTSAQLGVNVVNAAGTAWASGAITAASIAADAITAAKIADGAIDAGTFAADAITAAKIADDVSTEIANKVWDTDATGRQTQGTFGQAIGDPAADTNTIFKATVTDATGATVGVDAAAILADTGTDGVVVASINANAITAASINADAITDAKVAADVTIASVTGSVGSVTGAVGSVTGAVGSVTGAVGSVTGAVGSVTGAVGSVTGNVGGNVTGSVGSLAAQAKTDVKTEAVAALATDTYAEPVQGTPLATTTLAAKINYLYKNWRNKKTQTSTTFSLFNDDAVTVDQKSTVADDATTATRGEVATGP